MTIYVVLQHESVFSEGEYEHEDRYTVEATTDLGVAAYAVARINHTQQKWRTVELWGEEGCDKIAIFQKYVTIEAATKILEEMIR